MPSRQGQRRHRIRVSRFVTVAAIALGLSFTSTVTPFAQQQIAQESSLSSDRHPGGHGRPLRMAAYNIHHGAGNDTCTPPPVTTPPAAECALNLERVADIVRGLDLDVIAFQEVDRFWARSGYVDQAARLGELLRMNVCYGGNLDHQADNHADRPHQYGTAILTKRPLLACWNTLLPRAATNTEQRGLLHAVVKAHNGTPVHVYNTHLHTTVAERTVQVPAVDALIAQTSPSVLLGDLNAQPTETTLAPLQARFQDAWIAAGMGDGFTYPAVPDAAPNRRIDYAFVTSDLVVTEAAVEITPDTAMAADHYPLVIHVRVPRRNHHDDDSEHDRDRD
jgi:endonuclease/exonuclease/phosphatase family metal-dependent hydrolase